MILLSVSSFPLLVFFFIYCSSKFSHGDEWGDRDINSTINLLKSEDPSRPVMFHVLRHDGAGSELSAMLIFAGWAYSQKGWAYGGGIRSSAKGSQHGVNIARVAEFFFGYHTSFFITSEELKLNHYVTRGIYEKDIIHINPPWDKRDMVLYLHVRDITGPFISNCRRKTVQRPDILVQLLGEDKESDSLQRLVYDSCVLPPKYLSQLRKRNEKMIDEKAIFFHRDSPLTVAMHVRRGDAGHIDDAKRYTPNEYYIYLAKTIRAVYRNADIRVFSSKENTTREKTTDSEFTDFYENNIPVHFEDTAPVITAWSHFIRAHILVTAKSDFSIVPAFLNPHCVVYEPIAKTAFGLLDSWVTADAVDEQFIRSCSIAAS